MTRSDSTPQPAGPAPDEVSFTVMSYNVGNGMAKPERLVTLLRESGADVVGLQELAATQAEALAAELGEAFPHQVLFPTGFSGKGVLSRYPLLGTEQLHVYPERPDLHAVVDVDGFPLMVVVGHPPPQSFRRGRFVHGLHADAQIEALARLAVEHAPAVLLADFNMTERHPIYRRLTALGLVDAYRAAGAGRGYTVPTRFGQSPRRSSRYTRVRLVPFLRFDFVLHTLELETTAAWVGVDAGSDHLPVLARLRWRA
jgi:endonuclease/exonuclease/phosphatase (EEP) superfamily protein YafD